MSNQSKIAKEISDQFFTKSESANFCVQKMDEHGWMKGSCSALEPAAGGGDLVRALPKFLDVVSYDINDFGIGSVIGNFLDIPNLERYDLVFSNPPFGTAGGLAMRFLNHSAKFSDRLGFILPQSFRKISMINRINPYLHPVGNYDLPDQMFVLPSGEERKVLTCFLMFEVRDYKRKPFPFSYHDYFRRVDKENGEYAVRTQGASAGRILEGLDYSPSTTAFLVGNKDRVAKHDFTTIAKMTAGIPAIGLHDIAGALWLEDQEGDVDDYLRKGALSLLM